jgi:hypothetical protein
MSLQYDIEYVANLIKNARRVKVFTGAGISAQSGIPTFREPSIGLWEQHDPALLETASAFRQTSSAGVGVAPRQHSRVPRITLHSQLDDTLAGTAGEAPGSGPMLKHFTAFSGLSALWGELPAGGFLLGSGV